MAQRFSTCLRPRAWSWRPGIESHVGLPAWSLLLPLPVSLPLSLSLWLSWINKKFKKKKKKESQAPKATRFLISNLTKEWPWKKKQKKRENEKFKELFCNEIYDSSTHYHFEFINLTYPNILLTLHSHAIRKICILNKTLNMERPKRAESLQLVTLLL